MRRCGDVVVDNAHPAYDTPEQHAAILARLAQSSNKATPRPLQRRALMLSGILVCAKCGGQYHCHNDARAAFYYCANAARRTDKEKCSGRRILADMAERAVIEGLRREFLRPETIRRLVLEINKQRSDARPGIEEEQVRLERERKRLTREVNNLVTFIAETPSRAVAARLAEKEQQLAGLEVRVRALEAEERMNGDLEVSEGEMVQLIDNLVSLLESDKREIVWSIVHACVGRVEISGDTIKVFAKFPGLFQEEKQRLVEYPQPDSNRRSSP